MSFILDRYLSMHVDAALKPFDFIHRTKLNESHGCVNFIDDYVFAVDKDIDENGLSYFNKYIGSTYHTKIDIYDKIPELKELLDKHNEGEPRVQIPFFRYIDLTIDMNYSVNVNSTGGYDPNESEYKENGEGTVVINLVIYAPDVATVAMYVNHNIEHEFIHAFEDYERRFHKVSTLADKMRTDGYNGYLKITTNMTSFEVDLSNLLYFTYDPEINASIGELYSELRRNVNIVKNKDDKHSIMELIRSTNVYGKIEKSMKALKRLKDVSDDDLKNKLLDYANNKLRKKMDGDFYTEDDEYQKNNPPKQFRTYNAMMKYFTSQVDKYKDRFFTQASKMACDLFNNVKKGSHLEQKAIADEFARLVDKYSRVIEIKNKD